MIKMKKKLFSKTTALIIGSLVIFSGQAVAFPSNNQQLTNAKTMTKCEFIVAQISVDEIAVIKEALTQCSTTLGNAMAVAEVTNIPNKSPIISRLSMAQSLIGDILARLESKDTVTIGDAEAITDAIEQECTLVSEVKDLAKGTPLADTINQVEEDCCNNVNTKVLVEVKSDS